MSEKDESIRVLIADDHTMTRIGVRAVLEKTPDIKVVGEAQDGIEAKQMVAALHPDILLLDLVMPGLRSFEIEKWVRINYPETITLILTGHNRDSYLEKVIEAGAVGFLTKEEDSQRLVEAIRCAARGKVLITRGQLARAYSWREEVGKRWERLTRREHQVMALMANGKSTRQIAKAFIIGEHTVETHIGNILGKLDVASRAEAVAWAWQHGLVEELADEVDSSGEITR